jgi:hypothetical protein
MKEYYGIVQAKNNVHYEIIILNEINLKSARNRLKENDYKISLMFSREQMIKIKQGGMIKFLNKYLTRPDRIWKPIEELVIE